MTQTAELLIEILCAEIPARMQFDAAENLKKAFCEELKAQELSYSTATCYVTPRRLCLHIEEIPLQQKDRHEERRGPRVGSPDIAINGFLNSVGRLSVDECEKRDIDGNEFWFATKFTKGQQTEALIPSIITKIIESFTWPKSMRWARNKVSWVRPIQSIACVFHGKVVKGELNLGHDQLTYTDTTIGHRFHNPTVFSISDFKSYKQQLLAHKVILDQKDRKASIQGQITKLAASKGLKIYDDPGLLEEVTGLVEWPVALMGSIEPQFMDLPQEVLITAMRVHQRYFALEDEQGRLAPYFITIANIAALDGGATIIHGNERVLRARLADAKFFFENDKKIPLQKHAEKLKDAVFNADLGTVYEKTERVVQLSCAIAKSIGFAESEVKKAATLAKADLLTGMVGEFPELQGIMGYYYALQQGEDKEVAEAIADHYKPRGPGDDLPRSNVGKIVSLADKIDTLVGFFSIGIKPTGSKDPYALRRSALGCIRLLEGLNDLRLDELTAKSYLLYKSIFEQSKASVVPLDTLVEDMRMFFLDRLKVYWRDQGLRHDHIEAVFALGASEPLSILALRVKALDDFLNKSEGDGNQLLTAYRRASNIVRIEEKKENTIFDSNVNPDLFDLEPEDNLYKALNSSIPSIRACLNDHDFQKAMGYVAILRPHIDEFFDKVTVNANDPTIRVNRLRLLSLIRDTLHQVADFSKIEG